MTLLVRNEADILASNLDYHFARGVDFAIVTNHSSEDGTADILATYERRGLAHIITEGGDRHDQGQRVTRMARLAATRFQADWVINNDADEFWWPQLGSLHDVFASIPAQYGKVEVQRHNFIPIGASGDSPFRHQTFVRETSSTNLRGDPLEPKVAHRARPDIVIAPGNHSVEPAGLIAVPVPDLIEILHFPIRTYEQFERKVIQTGLGYELLPDRGVGVGIDQLRMLELQRAGGLRGYFDSLVLPPAGVESSIRSGRLVRDGRLQRFLVELGRESPRDEASDVSRRLLRATMSMAGELDSLRPRVVKLDGRVAALAGELTFERARAQALERERDHFVRTLEVIQSSKMFRLTAPIRRRYYRLRGRFMAKTPDRWHGS